MDAFRSGRSRQSGRSPFFVVAVVVSAGLVFCGYPLFIDWLLANPKGGNRTDPSIRRTEQSVQQRIDAFTDRRGRRPRDLQELKKGLVARLERRLPQYVDVEYDPEEGKVSVFEIDPFVPGPSTYSAFGAVGRPEERARAFRSTLRRLLDGYEERHGRFPEDIRDCVDRRRGRDFRLPVGYRIEYDAATGGVDVVKE
jgi:hypothetical protein